MMIVIYQLWTTIPEIAEYAGDAYLFQEPPEGHLWKDWVLEARDMFWKASIGMILHICFFFSIALWSFFEAIGKRIESPSRTETKNEP
jgi:hypothetical protein